MPGNLVTVDQLIVKAEDPPATLGTTNGLYTQANELPGEGGTGAVQVLELSANKA